VLNCSNVCPLFYIQSLQAKCCRYYIRNVSLARTAIQQVPVRVLSVVSSISPEYLLHDLSSLSIGASPAFFQLSLNSPATHREKNNRVLHFQFAISIAT
jgi:hypothetical protein